MKSLHSKCLSIFDEAWGIFKTIFCNDPNNRSDTETVPSDWTADTSKSVVKTDGVFFIEIPAEKTEHHSDDLHSEDTASEYDQNQVVVIKITRKNSSSSSENDFVSSGFFFNYKQVPIYQSSAYN